MLLAISRTPEQRETYCLIPVEACRAVETTSFHGTGHAVETMDAISQALSLPVKIYLDEIDKLGNYESILP